MYSLRQVSRGVRDPSLVLSEAVDQYFQRFSTHEGVNFFNQDWDTMVILDGCRYDLAADCSEFPGALDAIQSPASQTTEFLQKTVADRTFPDTVYVSANPQLTRVDAEFADVVPLWESAWDDDRRTVPPHAVVDALEDSTEAFVDKRLVVHFVQPHIPFIGPTGDQFEQPSFQGDVLENRGAAVDNVWMQLRRGKVAKEEVRRAYKENLQIALPAVSRLLDLVDGKTVITSDHGNAFGEWWTYGHPPGRHIDALTRVPWATVNTGQRPEITTTSKTISTADLDDDAVTNRLKHLGYV